MFSSTGFHSTLDDVRRQLASLDAACLTGPQSASMVETLTALIAAAEAARGVCARRVEETSLYKAEGRRSAADWLATKSGMSPGDAQVALDTATRLAELPSTEVAFRMGRISPHQAAAVSRAATIAPASEGALLETASSSSLKDLKASCRRVEASAGAQVEAERYEALRFARYFRHWVEDSGAVRLTGQLAPDDGARVIAALDAATDSHFRAAQKEGRREASQCYAADAFVELMCGTPTERTAPNALVHLTVSREALARGYVAGDEACEIAGVGPVAVATAKALMSDCILKVLVTKGADVCAVAGFGRTIPAPVRTALIQRDQECVVPHCNVRRGLEVDHIIPYANDGPSKLENLCRLCKYHHSMKTHRGFIIRGSPGQWEWVAPPAEADTG